MKLYIIILILLFFLPISTAEELEIQPPRLDTYFLYTGLGEEQISEYKFISNRMVSKCEMIPNDNITCVIEEGYIVKVWFTCNNQPYEGVLKITDDRGFIKSTPVLIRVYDFGVSADISPIYIGVLANSSIVNLFFSTSGEDIIGIRYWLIVWGIILLFMVVLIKVYL